MKRRTDQNVIGPQVRRFRCAKDWSQEYLAGQLQNRGWWIGRSRVARIESGEACVRDKEVLFLGAVLKVDVKELYPQLEPRQPVRLQLPQDRFMIPS